MSHQRPALALFLTVLLGCLFFLSGHALVASARAPLNTSSTIGSVGLLAHIDDMHYADAVTVNGNYAYVVDRGSQTREGTGYRDGGLTIFDVTDPAAPEEVAFAPIQWPDTIQRSSFQGFRVAVTDTYAYVSAGSDLTIFDVSTPSAPQQVGPTSGGMPTIKSIVGRYGYGTWGNGFGIVDLTNPSEPAIVGEYEGQAWAEDIAVGEGRVYLVDSEVSRVGGRDYSFHIVDVTTPTTPTALYVQEYSTLIARDAYVHLAVAGDYLYDVYDYFLSVRDVSDTSEPPYVGAYADLNVGTALAVSGRYAYVAEQRSGSEGAYSGGGLRVLDVSDPMAIRDVGFYRVSGAAERVAVRDELVYLTAGEEGLYILRFPSFPVHLPFVARQ